MKKLKRLLVATLIMVGTMFCLAGCRPYDVPELVTIDSSRK